MQKIFKALFALTITQGKQTCNIAKDELVYVDSNKFVKNGVIGDIRDFIGAFEEQTMPVPTTYPIMQFTASYLTIDAAGNSVLIPCGTQFIAYDRVVMVKGAIIDLSKLPSILKTVDAFRRAANVAFESSTYTVTAGSTVQTAITKDTDANAEYASSDEAIATVDADGLVTGVSAGEITLVVTTPETDAYTAGEATCTISVQPNSNTE